MSADVAMRLGELDCRWIGPREGIELAIVLCHGYGAPGTDLVPLGAEVLRARPDLDGRVAFVFPAAPTPIPGGWFGGRQWWSIEVGRYEEALRTGRVRDLMQDEPAGLPAARRQLTGTLDHLARVSGLPLGRIVLGGFSQGAMLATDVTLRSDEPPAALAIMSGTLLAEDIWRRFAPRRKGLRVLQSHGTQDPLLPFVGAEWLRDLLVEAGMEVSFLPFPGPHTIPPGMIAAIGEAAAELVG